MIGFFKRILINDYYFTLKDCRFVDMMYQIVFRFMKVFSLQFCPKYSSLKEIKRNITFN